MNSPKSLTTKHTLGTRYLKDTDLGAENTEVNKIGIFGC